MSERRILTGAASLQYLDSLGIAFCLSESRNGRKIGTLPCDDQGFPLQGNYLDLPQPLAVAVANVRRGKSAGMLPEYSNDLTLLDIDHGLDSFLEMFPHMAAAPRIFRPDAPDRAKLLIEVEFGSKLQRQDASEPTRKAELLGRGHGSVAGEHPTGEAYQLLTGEVVKMSRAEVEAMMEQWIPNAYTSKVEVEAAPAPPLSASPQRDASGLTLVEAAIAQWNIEHQDDVDQLVNRCPRRGQYFSTRPDDKTPSTLKVSEDAWRDFGQQAIGSDGQPLGMLDALDMYVRLTGENKRNFIWSVVVPEYRQGNKNNG